MFAVKNLGMFYTIINCQDLRRKHRMHKFVCTKYTKMRRSKNAAVNLLFIK